MTCCAIWMKKVPRILASSNQRRVIDTLLDSAGLTQNFQKSFVSMMLCGAKPDPEIFEKAHNRLGVPKNQLVILEDSANGIHAAHAAGIPGDHRYLIWLLRRQ